MFETWRPMKTRRILITYLLTCSRHWLQRYKWSSDAVSVRPRELFCRFACAQHSEAIRRRCWQHGSHLCHRHSAFNQWLSITNLISLTTKIYIIAEHIRRNVDHKQQMKQFCSFAFDKHPTIYRNWQRLRSGSRHADSAYGCRKWIMCLCKWRIVVPRSRCRVKFTRYLVSTCSQSSAKQERRAHRSDGRPISHYSLSTFKLESCDATRATKEQTSQRSQYAIFWWLCTNRIVTLNCLVARARLMNFQNNVTLLSIKCLRREVARCMLRSCCSLPVAV